MPLRIILAAWLIGAGSYAHPQGAADRPAKRPLTLADAIETVKADNEYVDNWTKPENVGVFSPDGSKFAFITQKSDLKRDVVAYSLWVIDTANALTSPRPKQVAKLSSSSNRPAISSLKWLPDNNTLVFLGEQPDETPQVYKAKSSTGHASKLTNQSTPIVSFSIDDAGESLVYLADVPAHPVFSPETLRRGFFVSSDQDWEELYTN
jgi:Tol biopolymer transport system component